MPSHSVTVWWLKTENNFPLSPDVTPVDADTKSANNIRCSAVTDTRHRTFASQRSGQVFLADGSDQVKYDLQICSVSFKLKNVCQRSLQKMYLICWNTSDTEYKYSLLCKSIVRSEQGKKCNLFWQSDFLVNLEMLCNSSKNYWVNDLIFTFGKNYQKWRGNSLEQ